jgi:pimeloyl-ACP methyl ester carboxylesterase
MNSFEFGGTGQPLHFLHANGYPPECYKPLFEFLKTEYRVFGMKLRPLWDEAKMEDLKSWHPLSDDLLRFLSDLGPGFDTSEKITRSTQPTPVIGVGHSIGATVTLRAALRDPGKFRALVLIDPVLFVPAFMTMWHIVRVLGLGDRVHPLIAGARKRRRTFDDLDTVFKGYRNRNVFRYMSDESLRAYIEGITRKTENGYELVYTPEWEVRIYRTSLFDYDIWRDLPKLEVPTLIIRGAETDTLLEGATRLIQRKQPKACPEPCRRIKIEALPRSTHLLPLERPKEVFEIMQSFLKSLE